ncbi:F0F1 ATP synthase subunit delta [Parabacteroides sp. 52]|uniref:F0F1 ATP synthase subunit delta n=1 Tax=unclassified Parabacteroides TaxID=2649774 RepID=UPI0013D287BA|nr:MULTISPECIES: F0F1 ATP synthase subunit delta [unclassified Parabacteroides]MDH6535462.1 F-type H+-transporting ATPase subunit delta [Parabacteroides sp. PM5-20]NDV55958.1 F0F1 ATP synthase subunit delta [Parabacteroides sp. 52]
MDRGTISRRYAIALYKYAQAHQKEKCIYDETLALSKSYVQYPAMKRTLASPVLPGKQKEELIVLSAGGNISEEFQTFIRLIIQQKREDFLQTICLSYQDIYRQEKKLLHVAITTAVPIDKKMEEKIVGRLEQLTAETVDIMNIVDPQIIGGYIMRWDTYRWDASITSQLRQIKQGLKLNRL